MRRPDTLISVGMFTIALSVAGLIGWVSAALDPECYYTTELFAQYRYCGQEFAGEERAIDFKALAVLLGGIAAGLVCIGLGKYGARRKQRARF